MENGAKIGVALAAVAGVIAVAVALRPRGDTSTSTPAPTLDTITLGAKVKPGETASTITARPEQPASGLSPAAAEVTDDSRAYVPGTYDGGLGPMAPAEHTDYTPPELAATHQAEVGAAVDQASTLV